MSFPRRVNRILGNTPSVGPIPGDMLMYFAGSVVIGLILKKWLEMDWMTTVFSSFAVFLGSYLCIGREEWKFFSQFIKVPRLVRVIPRYVRVLGLSHSEKNQYRARQSSRQKRK